MPELLRMPEIAAAQTSAVLASWPLDTAARFAAGDVVATVETDKAVVDVEAEADGVLLRTLVPAGAEVEVGTPIALLGAPGETVDDVGAALARLGVTAPAATPQGRNGHVGPSLEVAEPAAPGDGRRFASPLARRMATEAGLLLTDLDGTGPGGRIVRRDVEAALARRVAREEAEVAPDTAGAGPAAAAPPAPQGGENGHSGPSGTGFTDQPLSRMRRAVAARLAESKRTAPHFYLRGSARVDALLQVRAELNDGADARISVNDLLVRAVAKAHRLVPEMNVAWTGEAIRTFTSVDVAVAVTTANGLVTPVVRGAERLPIGELAAVTRDLATRAREGRLQQAELEGGSITVSNLGMYGVEEFAAIINPPQAAILAVGAARQEPVVTDGRLEVATVLRLTLSVDHRPVDGAVAARWMAALVGLLERPVRILS
jgi:pyruvate dehydrogenase E2 component (dihydrolipoamide acetyltransferase)